MSVVAGCSLFNGVILVADCRATIKKPGKPPIYIDNVQKLFVLTPTTALGFTGDIEVAARMLRNLSGAIKRCRNRGSKTAVGLLNWLPRYFRYAYRSLNTNRSAQVSFMIASIIPGRPQIIERARVVALMDRFRSARLSHKRNWLPSLFIDILKIPPDVSHIPLSDVPEGLLYVMKSPEFKCQIFKPLQFAAIGSGKSVDTQLAYEADWIFAGEVGNPYMEATAVRSCVSGFIYDHQIQNVGGLFPLMRIDGNGVRLFGHRAEIPIGGEKIELRISPDGHWSQVHLNSGTIQRVLPPWEIDFAQYSKNKTFDFLKEIEERSRRARRKKNIDA